MFILNNCNRRKTVEVQYKQTAIQTIQEQTLYSLLLIIIIIVVVFIVIFVVIVIKIMYLCIDLTLVICCFFSIFCVSCAT